MKTLIAVSTCHAYETNGENDAVRKTWWEEVPGSGVDAKFFVGRGPNLLLSDTVSLDVPDDYGHLTLKTIEKVRWALDQGYDYVLNCFADTYVRPDRLAETALQLAFNGVDLAACQMHLKDLPPFLDGGAGYLLSRLAMKAILDAKAPVHPELKQGEDFWVQNVISSQVGLVAMQSNTRFAAVQRTGPRAWNRTVTKHCWQKFNQLESYDPTVLLEEHRQWQDSVLAERVIKDINSRKVAEVPWE